MLLEEIVNRAQKRQNGCLQLRRRDGEEINLFLENGFLVHAQYKWTFGIEALVEASRWQNYTFLFDQTRQAPLRTLNLSSQDLETQLHSGREKIQHQLPKDDQGYFYNRSNNTEGLTESERLVLAQANGLSIAELSQRTGLGVPQVRQILIRLLERQDVAVDLNPATPERLKRTKPAQKNQRRGLLGVFARPKTLTLTDLELRVYDIANGALTLWDIHLHLSISREQVWEAYQALLKLDLLEPT